MIYRNILRSLVIELGSVFSKPANYVHILNSHFISRTEPQKAILERLLSQLSRSTKFIDIQEAILLIEEETNLTEPHITFTFDDGFEECHTMIAPVLEAFNTRGCFFVNPGFIDGTVEYKKEFVENKVLTPGKKPMNWEMIKDLHERGHIIGSHTIDHLRLNINETHLIEYQIAGCKKILEDKLDYECKYFAFPYGQQADLSETALNIASKYHQYIFSGSNYKSYYSKKGKVLNRRHIEGDWPYSHVKYFLSTHRTF